MRYIVLYLIVPLIVQSSTAPLVDLARSVSSHGSTIPSTRRLSGMMYPVPQIRTTASPLS